jgi:hypothetical protein
MRFRDVAKRLTGFTLPVVGAGVSWQPSEPESAVARRVLSFLEDRRVLYNPTEAEVPLHCVESILQTRTFLTQQVGELDPSSSLGISLNALRAECRTFLDATGGASGPRARHLQPGDWGFDSWVFNQALGALRRGFGVRIAEIAIRYSLDVPEPLLPTLPPDPSRT